MRFSVVALVSAVGAARIGRRAHAACGVKAKGPDTQIVNGDDAAECEWTWQVGFLRSNQTGSPFCGGSIIDEEWILSAAHCAVKANFYVVAGEHVTTSRTGKEQIRKAVQVIRHPKYEKNSFDVLLVRVDEPFTFNNCVGSVCLPSGDIEPGRTCWITGWGTLSPGGGQPTTLQQAEVMIISNSDCTNKYGYYDNQIDDSMTCAQGRKPDGAVTDACQGDSGGPLVCESEGQYSIYGATSWGRGCAGANYPGIWANINHVGSWITETMANPPEMCPDYALNQESDRDGDCKCSSGYCSVTGGTKKDCPTSNGPGAYGGSWFSVGCSNCMCFGA